jgi:hypothetical protein
MSFVSAEIPGSDRNWRSDFIVSRLVSHCGTMAPDIVRERNNSATKCLHLQSHCMRICEARNALGGHLRIHAEPLDVGAVFGTIISNVLTIH